jgi:hypothetical protein
MSLWSFAQTLLVLGVALVALYLIIGVALHLYYAEYYFVHTRFGRAKLAAIKRAIREAKEMLEEGEDAPERLQVVDEDFEPRPKLGGFARLRFTVVRWPQFVFTYWMLFPRVHQILRRQGLV